MPTEKRPMFIAPGDIGAQVLPTGNVGLSLGGMPLESGFDDDILLCLELSPAECLDVARLLTKKALEALGEGKIH